jgi:peptidyl-prolyl cis-trans isomerase C
MKKIAMLAILLLAAAAFSGCSSGKKGEMLVEINGHEVTTGDLKFLGSVNPRITAMIASPEGKKKILDNLVEQTLLYQEAVKKGINRKQDVKDKVDLYRQVIIAQALVDDEAEKEAKKYYDEHPEEFKKLALSQIMIKYSSPEDIKKAKEKKAKVTLRNEQEALKLANAVKARLDKGEDFATVAKEVSEDSMTKSRGGDLGLVAEKDPRLEARGLGPILDKAFEMKVGEIAGPIKTNQGYHIITVTRGVEAEPFEEAKDYIIFKNKNNVKIQLVERLKKDSKIVYAEEVKKEMEKEAQIPGMQGPTAATVTPEKTETAPAAPVEQKASEAGKAPKKN